jgi:hypothetical protein
MRLRRLVPALAVAVVLTACARIPPEAVEVNEQVGEGISTLQQNNLQMIEAWADLTYFIVDESGGEIHDRAAAAFERRADSPAVRAELARGVSRESIIAGIAVEIRDKVRDRVAEEADKMRAVVNANARETSGANVSITRLLTSANAVVQTRASILERVGDLSPINIPEIAGFVEQAIEDVTGGAFGTG